MSVQLIRTKSFYGYRVRRSIAGKMEQHYLSLVAGDEVLTGKGADWVKIQAEALDKVLLDNQKAAAKNRLIRASPTTRQRSVTGIKGINRIEVKGKPFLLVSIQSLKLSKRVAAKFNMDILGAEDAARKAIDFFCEHKLIRHKKPLLEAWRNNNPK